MNEEKLFDPILDNDEKIVEIFKPNRTRFVTLSILAPLFPLLVFIIIGVVLTVGGNSDDFAAGLILLAFPLIMIGIIALLTAVRYKKTIYCYTNKRVILRTGFIGADFQAIDFDLIGAMNVRVDFLDKLCKPNTGSIMFASPASPMIQNNQPGGHSGYAFMHIDNPYEVYKRVKEFSSKNKDGKLNS